MSTRLTVLAVASLLASTACGSSSTPAQHETGASSAKAVDPPANTTTSDSDHDDGPETSDTSVGAVPPSPDVDSLDMLLKKGETSGFPSASESDSSCLGQAGLVGDSVKDFNEVAKHCGANTGMKPMTKIVTKKLDGSHTRDTYDYKMVGGFCYRFFAVGAPSLQNFAFRVERPNGAFVSGTQTTEGVAVLDPKEPWCKKHDREFHLVIEAKGKSSGAYTLGIWARPSK